MFNVKGERRTKVLVEEELEVEGATRTRDT